MELVDLASRSAPMAKGWIKGATSGAHGQFRRKAEAAGETTRQFAREHAGDKGKTGQQARLAETLMGLNSGKKKPSRRALIYDRSNHDKDD